MTVQQASKTTFPTAREAQREIKVAALVPKQVCRSDESLEKRIRERAYFLAEAAGFPEGSADEFWHQAEKEVRQGGTRSYQ